MRRALNSSKSTSQGSEEEGASDTEKNYSRKKYIKERGEGGRGRGKERTREKGRKCMIMMIEVEK